MCWFVGQPEADLDELVASLGERGGDSRARGAATNFDRLTKRVWRAASAGARTRADRPSGSEAALQAAGEHDRVLDRPVGALGRSRWSSRGRRRRSASRGRRPTWMRPGGRRRPMRRMAASGVAPINRLDRVGPVAEPLGAGRPACRLGPTARPSGRAGSPPSRCARLVSRHAVNRPPVPEVDVDRAVKVRIAVRDRGHPRAVARVLRLG